MRGHRSNRSPQGPGLRGPASPGLPAPDTSGARYSGVPQKVFMVAPSLMPSLHRPKSVILMWPSLSSMRFSSCRKSQRVRDIAISGFPATRNPTCPCPSLGWGVVAWGCVAGPGGGVREQSAPQQGVRPSEAQGEESDPAPPQPLPPPGSWEDRAGGDGSQVLPDWLPPLSVVVVTLQA